MARHEQSAMPALKSQVKQDYGVKVESQWMQTPAATWPNPDELGSAPTRRDRCVLRQTLKLSRPVAKLPAQTQHFQVIRNCVKKAMVLRHQKLEISRTDPSCAGDRSSGKGSKWALPDAESDGSIRAHPQTEAAKPGRAKLCKDIKLSN